MVSYRYDLFNVCYLCGETAIPFLPWISFFHCYRCCCSCCALLLFPINALVSTSDVFIPFFAFLWSRFILNQSHSIRSMICVLRTIDLPIHRVKFIIIRFPLFTVGSIQSLVAYVSLVTSALDRLIQNYIISISLGGLKHSHPF